MGDTEDMGTSPWWWLTVLIFPTAQTPLWDMGDVPTVVAHFQPHLPNGRGATMGQGH